MVWFDVRDRQGKLHELVFTALRIVRREPMKGQKQSVSRLQQGEGHKMLPNWTREWRKAEGAGAVGRGGSQWIARLE